VRIYAVSPTAFVTDSGARIEFREKGETVGISNFENVGGRQSACQHHGHGTPLSTAL
jgi:hypothetical protein